MRDLTSNQLVALEGGTDMADFGCGFLAFWTAGAFLRFGPMAAFFTGAAAYGVCLYAVAAA